MRTTATTGGNYRPSPVLMHHPLAKKEKTVSAAAITTTAAAAALIPTLSRSLLTSLNSYPSTNTTNAH
jgi:hypothetical protein